jgi:hypothetical protein
MRQIKSTQRTSAQYTFVPVALSAAIAASAIFSSAAFANGPKPDALLQIDLHRSAVAERIVESWKKDIPAAQISSFRSKLMGLRADQLLAANLSGSFDGVLELLSAHERLHVGVQQKINATTSMTQNTEPADQSKALGEVDRDLLYTPIVPCRLFDTRTGQGGSGPIAAATSKTFDTSRPAGSFASQGGSATDCAVPAGVAAVVVVLTSVTPPASGFLTLYPNGATNPFPNAISQTYQPGLVTATEVISGTQRTAGAKVSVYSTQSVDVAADAIGYFMSPSRNGDGLRIVAGPISNATLTGPNVLNGAKENFMASDVFGSTISGGGGPENQNLPSASIRNEIFSSFGVIGGGSKIQSLNPRLSLPSEVALKIQ